MQQAVLCHAEDSAADETNYMDMIRDMLVRAEYLFTYLPAKISQCFVDLSRDLEKSFGSAHSIPERDLEALL